MGAFCDVAIGWVATLLMTPFNLSQSVCLGADGCGPMLAALVVRIRRSHPCGSWKTKVEVLRSDSAGERVVASMPEALGSRRRRTLTMIHEAS